jgi:hypothetical protein
VAYELADGHPTSPVCMMQSGPLLWLCGAHTRPDAHPFGEGDCDRPQAKAATLHVGAGSVLVNVGGPQDAPFGTVWPRA